MSDFTDDAKMRCNHFLRRVPREYRACRFNNYEAKSEYQQHVVAECRKAINEIVAGECLNVILYGPAGTGKDHLAICVAAGIVLRHEEWPGFWHGCQDVFSAARDGFTEDRTEHDWLNDHSKYGVLVLSDPTPPVGNLTPWQSQLLYRLVEDRARNGWPTIITANLSGATDGDEKLGASTFDRMKNRAYVLQCNWPSYRKPFKIVKSDG